MATAPGGRLAMLTSAGTISGCGDRVPDGGVAAEPLLVHLGQHRHEGVHIVDDRHRALAFVEPMEPSGILLNGAAPGDGQGQEQGVESSVVETLADVPSSGQEDSRSVVGDRGERAAIARRWPAPIPPRRTTRCSTCGARSCCICSRCSVRSVRTSGEWPRRMASRRSATIPSVRGRSATRRE